MPKRKLVSTLLCSFFSAGLLAGFAYATTKTGTVLHTSIAQSESSSEATLTKKEVSLDDFSSAEEVSRKELTVDIVSANKTPLSKSITFEFSSIRTTGYSYNYSSRNPAYIVIDDDNFSGNTTDPFMDDTLGTGLNGYTKELMWNRAISSNSEKNWYAVPSMLKWTSSDLFQIHNTRIAAGALDLSEKTKEQVKVEKIVIPKEVTTIDSGAFKGIGDKIKIACEASTAPTGWAADWIDIPATEIQWGAELQQKEKVFVAGSVEKNFDEGTPFFVGYINHGEGFDPSYPDIYKPLVISYKVDTPTGSREVIEELPLNPDDTSRANPYDAVGKIGNYTITRSYDVILEEGEVLDYSSFAFNNIFKVAAEKVGGKYVPDTTVSYSSKTLKRFDEEIDITKIIKYNFVRVSTFMDYTVVTMNIDKAKPYYYETIMADEIDSYRDKMETGEYTVRYAFYDLGSAYYRLTYGDGQTKDMRIVTPLSAVALDKDSGNQFSFLIKNSDVGPGFSASSLKSFNVLHLTINMHLWNNSSSSIVSHSAYNAHFGEVDVLQHDVKNLNLFDVNLFLILFAIIYTVAFIAGDIALFFILKEKFKNDEFRRMKPKSFFTKSAISFVGSLFVALTLVFIIFRWSVFNNSIATFNPTDVFVVIGGIISIIIIGYFVKYMIQWFKVAKQRRRLIKLKINLDVADDGTK